MSTISESETSVWMPTWVSITLLESGLVGVALPRMLATKRVRLFLSRKLSWCLIIIRGYSRQVMDPIAKFYFPKSFDKFFPSFAFTSGLNDNCLPVVRKLVKNVFIFLSFAEFIKSRNDIVGEIKIDPMKQVSLSKNCVNYRDPAENRVSGRNAENKEGIWTYSEESVLDTTSNPLGLSFETPIRLSASL